MNTIKRYYTIPAFCELEELDPTKVTYYELDIHNTFFESTQSINFIEILIGNKKYDLEIRLLILRDYALNNEDAEDFIDKISFEQYLQEVVQSKSLNNETEMIEVHNHIQTSIEKELHDFKQNVLTKHNNFLKGVK